MSADLSLPWPQCLGVFDEESCRYFLHEVGRRIVPNYPFSFGIEEVYGLILEQYGVDETSDATGLLQELLEDSQNATGLGDDGDVWRSWRYSWRHRNDDARNPFIPRFGSLVLKPSTAPSIRLLKANNFIRLCQQDFERVIMDITINHASVSRQNGMNDGNHSTAKHLPTNAEDIERNLTTSIPTSMSLKNNKHVWRHLLRSLGRTKATNFIQSHQYSTSNDTVLNVRPFQVETKHNPESSTQLRGGEKVDYDWLDRHDLTTATNKDRVLFLSDCSRQQSFKSDSLRRCVTTNVVRETKSACSDEAQQQQQPPKLSPNSRNRVVNRQARLIDGTIFTSRTSRSKTLCQSSVVNPLSSDVDHKTSNRLSWSPRNRRDSLRKSWTRDLRRLFRRDKQEIQTCVAPKHCSVQQPQKSSISVNFSKHSMAPSRNLHHSPEHLSQQLPGQFGFDGASDQSRVCTSGADLNKPLPLSPDEIVKSMSSRSQLASSHHSDNTSNLPSTASTTSSVSRSSSKKEFRSLARDLLQTEIPAQHELTPICEVDVNNRKPFMDPSKSSVPASPVSYSSVAQSNPFLEKKHGLPIRPPPLDFRNLRKGEVVTAIPTVPELQGSTNFTSPLTTRFEDHTAPLPWKSMSCTQYQEDVEPLRGRSKPGTGSPTVKQKENLPPKTPTKRSRSPIKRFLGLTKSTSANKLDDTNTFPQPVTPSSTKIDSLKKWGDRFRYGFLTPDQEQLRQENLIQAHHNDSNTSTPQHSTFPVSLEPPVQAKLQSEIELIIAVTANRYLLREARAGRISAESVAKIKEMWEKMNRPQVVEFHYDQLTQHNLIIANLDRVKLHGDAAQDAIAINSTMRGWKIMAKEMSVRTFCSPDSVIRKHLHDAHRVLELLGAPLVTFLAYEDMQLKTLAKITQRQKERMDRRAGSAERDFSTAGSLTQGGHRRNVSEGSYQQNHDHSEYPITALQMDKISLSPSPAPLSGGKVRKATGAQGVIMSLPTNFERSRDGYAANLRKAKMGQTLKEI